MRIDEGQKILGYPAVQVRQLMREAARRPLRLGLVQEILGCSDSSARGLARELETAGFVELVKGRLEPSIKGNALAMATASPALRRDTAERLIGDVVSRAGAINRDKKWAYQIATLVLFGSCVRNTKRPNDVDIACELIPRFDGDQQLSIEQTRRSARKKGFRNLSHRASWPKVEVSQFLKGRSRGLSLQELEDWHLSLRDHRVIFRQRR